MKIRPTPSNLLLVLFSLICMVISVFQSSTDLLLAAMLGIMWASLEFTE